MANETHIPDDLEIADWKQSVDALAQEAGKVEAVVSALCALTTVKWRSKLHPIDGSGNTIPNEEILALAETLGGTVRSIARLKGDSPKVGDVTVSALSSAPQQLATARKILLSCVEWPPVQPNTLRWPKIVIRHCS